MSSGHKEIIQTGLFTSIDLMNREALGLFSHLEYQDKQMEALKIKRLFQVQVLYLPGHKWDRNKWTQKSKQPIQKVKQNLTNLA